MFLQERPKKDGKIFKVIKYKVIRPTECRGKSFARYALEDMNRGSYYELKSLIKLESKLTSTAFFCH